MPIVHVPQRRKLDRWSRLQRFFHFEGRLGGLRYGARFEITELSPPEQSAPPGRALGRPVEEDGPA